MKRQTLKRQKKQKDANPPETISAWTLKSAARDLLELSPLTPRLALGIELPEFEGGEG